MNYPDIRWEQRFSNYNKALKKLEEAVYYIKQQYPNKDHTEQNSAPANLILNDLIKQGLIQNFEYTHELAWNVMKDYAVFQGNSTIGGSRDATREALQLKIIQDGHVWMQMISSRNKTSHTYNEDTANDIFSKIIYEYYPAFVELRKTMEEKRTGSQSNLFTE